MQVDHPFHIDGRERTATTTEAEHIRDMIELILFTAPGERVMRPDFGAGVLQLVFAPLSQERAAAAQFVIQGTLQQHLGNRIAVQEIAVEAVDATMRIRIAYEILRTGERVIDDFSREVAT